MVEFLCEPNSDEAEEMGEEMAGFGFREAMLYVTARLKHGGAKRLGNR